MDSTKRDHSAAPDTSAGRPAARPVTAPSAAAPPADDSMAGAVRRTAGWLAGMVVVAAAGWGVVYLVWRLARDYKLIGPDGDGAGVAVGVGFLLSFVLFALLERNYWLTRLSGLSVPKHGNPLWPAFLDTAFGVPGLIVRAGLEHPQEKDAKPSPVPGHAPREAIETIVFVVVLVFLLKQFVVEAFVIPTGSMAETLYGYQKVIECPECGHEFPLNASYEVDPQPGHPRRPIEGYCCPNCRYKSAFSERNPPPPPASGDRVLVHKAMYAVDEAQPGDVVVFKFPQYPQRDYSAQNYIKRMWGVGGDTIAIWRGDLYVCKSLVYPPPEGVRPEDLWDKQFTHANAEDALKKFEESRAAGFPAGQGGFKLIRKSDDLALAMRRLVYDNDRPSRLLTAKGAPPRWKAETTDWSADDPAAPRVFTHTGAGLGWVRYRHMPVPDWKAMVVQNPPVVHPVPVDNFLGYNAETTPGGEFKNESEDSKFWVGDLMLECRVRVTDPAGAVTLELSKGPNRFQAVFADGKLTLTRTGPGGGELGTWPTRLNGPGTYDLRFANIDCRLRVWVDGRPVAFGPEADYAPATPDRFDPKDEKKEGWTTANDVEAPAGVGATGGVEISHLKLWRDTYFINQRYAYMADAVNTIHTYYVQPGHYLCLGDNSAQSSDGREWGAVPERLMLGRAVFVFAPFLDPNYLFKPRLDRVGFIR